MTWWVLGGAAAAACALVAALIALTRKKAVRQFVTANSLEGHISIVTGANTGIGKATAAALARGGGVVVLACRSRARAEAAMEEIRKEDSSAALEFLHLDLSSRESTVAAAKEFLDSNRSLQLLVNNAGVVPTEFILGEGEDAQELTWRVNHLNTFLFTQLLLPRLAQSASSSPARIVFVNSGSHRIASALLAKLQAKSLAAYVGSVACYSWMKTYAETKLAAMLCYHELHRRIQAAGLSKKIAVFAVNPGPVNTDIARNAPSYLSWIINPMMKHTFKTPARGAETSLMAAVAADVVSGLYYDDCKQCAPAAFTRGDKEQRLLWDATCEIALHAAMGGEPVDSSRLLQPLFEA